MSRRQFWALVAPSVVVMFGFMLVPLYRTVRWSFERVNYGEVGTFIGLENYRAALTGTFSRSVPAGRSRNRFTTSSAAATCSGLSPPPDAS